MSHADARKQTVESAFMMCHEKRLEWNFDNEEDLYEWQERMKRNGEFGEENCLQIIRLHFFNVQSKLVKVVLKFLLCCQIKS